MRLFFSLIILYIYPRYRGTLFFYFIIIFSHKTLPEHNTNKVPSLEFYVREPNYTDPLSLSLSNFISLTLSLCRLIYFASCIYVPTSAGPADTAPSALYLYIGTLIGHHYPGRYTGRNESKRIETRKKKRQIYQTNFVLRPTSIVGHCRRPGYCRKRREKNYIYTYIFFIGIYRDDGFINCSQNVLLKAYEKNEKKTQRIIIYVVEKSSSTQQIFRNDYL